MFEFELDIPSLISEGIQIDYYAFVCVRELSSWSMIDNDWDADSLDQFIRHKSDCLRNIERKNNEWTVC